MRNRKCNTCGEVNPNKFYSYIFYKCKLCSAKRKAEYEKTVKGTVAKMWRGLNYRVRMGKQNIPKYKCYKDIEVRMTRQEFVTWATPRVREWKNKHPGASPSPDRINSKGHYELGNLNIVDHEVNRARSSAWLKRFKELTTNKEKLQELTRVVKQASNYLDIDFLECAEFVYEIARNMKTSS